MAENSLNRLIGNSQPTKIRRKSPPKSVPTMPRETRPFQSRLYQTPDQTEVAVFVVVTIAPTMTAPVGSVTVPVMAPRSVWAESHVRSSKRSTPK